MELSPDWEVINKKNEAKTARLMLEDGSVFDGYSFGACRSSLGEVGTCVSDHVNYFVSETTLVRRIYKVLVTKTFAFYGLDTSEDLKSAFRIGLHLERY